MDEEHYCWSECCDQGPHACICGNDCKPEGYGKGPRTNRRVKASYNDDHAMWHTLLLINGRAEAHGFYPLATAAWLVSGFEAELEWAKASTIALQNALYSLEWS